jgi:hypothetical protein
MSIARANSSESCQAYCQKRASDKAFEQLCEMDIELFAEGVKKGKIALPNINEPKDHPDQRLGSRSLVSTSTFKRIV